MKIDSIQPIMKKLGKTLQNLIVQITIALSVIRTILQYYQIVFYNKNQNNITITYNLSITNGTRGTSVKDCPV